MGFGDGFSRKKKLKMSNFMKVRPVRAELFHAEGKTDDEGSSYSSRVCERVWKLNGHLVVVLTCLVLCGCVYVWVL